MNRLATVLKNAAGIALICALSAMAATPAAKEARYANPVIFQRAEVDESSGKTIVGGKLWVMDLDGSGLRQLTFGPTYDEHPSLYSGQQHVLYSEFDANSLDREAGARLIKLNIYTGAREVVAEAAGCALHHASLSPIDDRLVYHRDCGKRQSQWVGWGTGSYEVAMRATNGVAIRGAVIAMHEKNLGISPREVALVRIEGHGKDTKATFLTDDKVLHRRGAISPDGKWLAWQTNAAGPEDEIFLANIDGSNARNLTKAKGNDGHPWFSRDAKWIVFESDRSGQWEIWRLDLATGKQEQLTHGGKKYVSTRARM